MLDKMTLEQLRERRFLNSVRGIRSSAELIAEIERREAATQLFGGYLDANETVIDTPCPHCFREEAGHWITPCPADDCPSNELGESV